MAVSVEMPCTLADIYLHFRGTYCLHFLGRTVCLTWKPSTDIGKWSTFLPHISSFSFPTLFSESAPISALSFLRFILPLENHSLYGKCSLLLPDYSEPWFCSSISCFYITGLIYTPTLKMEAAGPTGNLSTRLHGVTPQKTVIFNLWIVWYFMCNYKMKTVKQSF
jgi:hypothetical protein